MGISLRTLIVEDNEDDALLVIRLFKKAVSIRPMNGWTPPLP